MSSVLFTLIGDLISQTGKEGDGNYNSVSDQYKESHFQPLTLKGK